jgi:hypothetical protein
MSATRATLSVALEPLPALVEYCNCPSLVVTKVVTWPIRSLRKILVHVLGTIPPSAVSKAGVLVTYFRSQVGQLITLLGLHDCSMHAWSCVRLYKVHGLTVPLLACMSSTVEWLNLTVTQI